ncbi:hypothetical protein A2223_02340 [Candidatus Falkowbacteria bacterium RIFOXYA2_FULL_35_8]|uniref:LysM domain-containing protein n=1 Tax=Candidatus Falkowbacteria bacterium RIFOXYC2_FULL_36_12 TaxID=1798002 RepID=A0A1F5T383_9BACT|nr:MAG: hypothetical protein A2300_01820 [Candidatus Falkowbacteria bacterium RIFOXYB2_FULL_35_7]OGF33425.1 MAG: hypothetical protein A2478_01870 [Candidatus Falkowbacteria bacterium RIFOXYC2_FULL_36_12]OGF33921.1 MAG: hypothetical protein A2223_02340 [Candidatus Falkowbacteria bacterium RIFOXYA2_FULL_35_8]
MFNLKRFSVKQAIKFINFLKLLKRKPVRFFTFSGRCFSYILNKFARFLLLPIYKSYIYSKQKLLGYYSPARNKLAGFLTKKYLVHFLIIALSMFVFVGNINAQETREENFGEKTVVYALFQNQAADYEIVEEKANFSPDEKILSYLDKSSQITSTTTMLDSGQVSAEQLAEGFSAVTAGGSAVLKSNIVDTDLQVASGTRNKVIVHTVQSGETVSTIASGYGISINTVLWANSLSANSVIKPGMTLNILPVSGVEHKVVSGDTIQSIAKKYGIESSKIIEYNNLSDDGSIVISQGLILPGAEKPVSSIVSRSTNYTTTPNVSITKIFQPDYDTARGSSSGAGSMAWPTTWRVITQYFNWRHTGLDIDGDYNSPILAAEAGVVTRVGWGNGYGNMVLVDHGGGIVTLYAHLQTFSVKVGQSVSRGQQLGMMGSTGFSTGTHIHFEVQVNGVKKNPLSYIR